MTRFHLIICFLVLFPTVLFGQSEERPSHKAGKLLGEIKIDGLLNELDWQNAPVLDEFLTTEPSEKGIPSSPTIVRVIADEKFIVIGIDCKDPNPDNIVRFSKVRDANISNEDYIKVVLDPFLDGQSGFILCRKRLCCSL